MAKGDREAVQGAINNYGGTANTNTQGQVDRTGQQQQQYYNNYLTGTNTSLNDYSSIMNNYNNFLNSQAAQGANPPQKQDFGNLSDPNAWMNLVSNPQQLSAWVKQNNPNISDSDLNYYVSKIQGQPGANPTEQAGGAQYWLGRMQPGGQVQGSINNNTFGDYSGAIGSALGGYQNFANTGGFSPQDIQDIRARAIGPTRSIYDSAQNNIDRQRSLQNGYAPNAIAAQAKLARDESQQISDVGVNANAAIAQMVQQGKLAGLLGLSNTGLAGQGQNLAARGQDLSNSLGYAGLSTTQRGQDLAQQLGLRGQNLSAIGGSTNLYGQSPGLAGTFGNQNLAASGQGLEAQGLQNQLGLGLINAQQNQTRIPSNFQQGLGNLASIFGLGGTAGNILSGLGNLFGLGNRSGQPGTVGINNGVGGQNNPYTGMGPYFSGTDYGSQTNLPADPYAQSLVNTNWGVANPNYGFIGPVEPGYDPYTGLPTETDPRVDPQQGY